MNIDLKINNSFIPPSYDDIKDFLNQKNLSHHIEGIIEKDRISYIEFLMLLSEDAIPFLQKMVMKSHMLTLKRFGKTIYFYAPLYLSNECESNCIYCGFSKMRKFERISLNIAQIEDNYKILKQKGFDNILLLTGEARNKFGTDKIKEAVILAKKYFSFVGIEVFPMREYEYKEIADAGCDGVTLYQETYNEKVYSKMHLEGEKKDFYFRLNSPERVLSSGFRKIGIGSLFGLSEPLYEAASLGAHAYYLQKKFWKSEVSLSFPRIRPENILSKIPYEVSDKILIQIICALRIFLPETAFVLSTRETSEFRDKMIQVAITQISAGSKTNPGGYTENESKEQFKISDERDLKEMKAVICNKGFDAVIKDWSKDFTPVIK